MIAPMVAAQDKDVAYIVMLAGTAVPGGEINDYQNVLSLKSAGVTDSNIHNFLELHHALVKAATSAENQKNIKAKYLKFILTGKNQSSETVNDLS